MARVVPETLAVQPAAGSGPGGPTRPAGKHDPQVNDQPAAAGAGPAAAADAGRDALALADPTAGDAQTPGPTRTPIRPRVVLRAREQLDPDVEPGGDYAFTRTLQPGDVFLVPNRTDLELWTGNAGGLEVIVDGTPVPALGDAGAVVRATCRSIRERLLQATRPR